ncbi:hypothetical protein RchiOBHm_Chr1g0328461 [Rosa chinensis]|uniref:Uncharacterized protein n=1 Tax=Rosa chinensis TaxID=74649 RepID=A0A2P6SAR9_ROSCH|nr:hypothetical protein RchiOBHm_Chr1g0328461 [Rosa chinensis]
MSSIYAYLFHCMLLIDYIEDNAIFKCGGRDLYFCLLFLVLYILKKKKNLHYTKPCLHLRRS